MLEFPSVKTDQDRALIALIDDLSFVVTPPARTFADAGIPPEFNHHLDVIHGIRIRCFQINMIFP